jgi:hypothetical protein
MKKLLLSLTALVSLTMASAPVLAGNWRFAPDGMGGGHFYNQNGQYTGRFAPDGFGGGRFYNQDGEYRGRISRDGFGGVRFYDEN